MNLLLAELPSVGAAGSKPEQLLQPRLSRENWSRRLNLYRERQQSTTKLDTILNIASAVEFNVLTFPMRMMKSTLRLILQYKRIYMNDVIIVTESEN